MKNKLIEIEKQSLYLAKESIPPFIPARCSLLEAGYFLAMYYLYLLYYTDNLDRTSASTAKQRVLNDYLSIYTDAERLYNEYQQNKTIENADVVINYLYKEIIK